MRFEVERVTLAPAIIREARKPVLRPLVLVFHYLCASYPVQPNCHIAVFQLAWRLAAHFHFRLPKCCVDDDDCDSLVDYQLDQAPHELRVMRHRFADSNGPCGVRPMRFVKMKGTSREGLRIHLMRDDACQ